MDLAAPINRFWYWVNSRELIRKRKEAGVPPAAWTADPIFCKYRFTNVRREDDRTTVWFRENARRTMGASGKNTSCVRNALIFRWFNRIDVGEMLAEDRLFQRWDGARAEHVLRQWRPSGPWVTGAYIIKGFSGYDKLKGVCLAISAALVELKPMTRDIVKAQSMEEATKTLMQCEQLGPFMAYEIACDLRYTPLLSEATDRFTWANPGPGARRGLNRIHRRPLQGPVPTEQCIEEMQWLLGEWADFGPQLVQPPEMREVEHSLCEFDKYERVRLGQGRPRQVYRHEE